MKRIVINLFALVLVMEAVNLSSSMNVHQSKIINSKVEQSLSNRSSLLSRESNRFKRQTNANTTTPKPKKHRPSNIFSLISVLLAETRNDTSRAFNEIGTLFNSQFANATTKKPSTTTTTTTSSPPSSDNDEDNEVTTTTEAFRITRDEFLGILRSNVRGIVNLFGKEFRVAIKIHAGQAYITKPRTVTCVGKTRAIFPTNFTLMKVFKILSTFLNTYNLDSNQNVREFGRDLGNALAPYFNN